MAAMTVGGREPALVQVSEPGVASARVVSLERDENLIGREAACDVVLGPPTVSRRHARITRRGGGYVLEDLGSTGGTWLNGQRLAGSPVVLQEGDRILIGPCELVFRAADPASSMETTILDERDISEAAERQLAEVRAEEKLRALLEIAREQARTHDPTVMLDRILASLLRVFPRAERALVLLRDDSEPAPVLRAYRDRDGTGTRSLRRFSRTVLSHVLDLGKAVLCADISDDLRFAQSLSADDVPYRTMMCVPLRDHHGRHVGLLQLDTPPERGPFTPEDLELLAALAGPISLAVDNARLLEATERARAEAVAAGRAKDRFLAVLSHELRTPLTPALIAASALLEDEPGPDQRSALEIICRNIALEARLIDDLLDLTRITRGQLSLDRRRLDAHEVIRQALEVCRNTIDEAGLFLDLRLDAAEATVDADPTRLQQVVWNLIQNAAKFTPTTGTVTIRTRNAAPADTFVAARLILEVSDTGDGIAPDALTRIFDPFEQGTHGPRFRARGLGLGLAISRSLAEAHGGSLTARSAGEGWGATFTLELPVAGRWFPADADETTPGPTILDTVVVPPAPVPPTVSVSDSEGRIPALRILLVEDNRDTLRSLAMVLRARGHQIAEAETLAAARSALAVEPVDLLVSDIELPDGSGLDLMRELATGSAPGKGILPGIAMSGFGSEEDHRRSLEAGFTFHLTKPVVAGQLEDAIRQALAARRTA